VSLSLAACGDFHGSCRPLAGAPGRASGAPATPGSPRSAPAAYGLLPPGVRFEPGPWMTMNQNEKAVAQMAAVIANMRASAPER
jgi:hypothetical protein